MNTEYLIIYNSSYGEAIKTLNELFPKLQGIPPFAFIVEAVDPVDRAAFVIASEKEEVLGIFYLICQHKTYDLHVLLSPIYIITQKEIV